MSTQESSHSKALGVRFTPEDFNTLAYHARRYEMNVRAFVEYMARCYLTSMREEEQAQVGKDRGQ